MAGDTELAAEKARKLNEILADMKSGKDVSGAVSAMGAKRVAKGETVDLPASKFIAVSCSGCGCVCHSAQGAGHGCGEHAGHWA